MKLKNLSEYRKMEYPLNLEVKLLDVIEGTFRDEEKFSNINIRKTCKPYLDKWGVARMFTSNIINDSESKLIRDLYEVKLPLDVLRKRLHMPEGAIKLEEKGVFCKIMTIIKSELEEICIEEENRMMSTSDKSIQSLFKNTIKGRRQYKLLVNAIPEEYHHDRKYIFDTLMRSMEYGLMINRSEYEFYSAFMINAPFSRYSGMGECVPVYLSKVLYKLLFSDEERKKEIIKYYHNKKFTKIIDKKYEISKKKVPLSYEEYRKIASKLEFK